MLHHSIRIYGPRAFHFRATKWFATAWIEKGDFDRRKLVKRVMIHHSIRTYGPRAFYFRATEWFATAWIEKCDFDLRKLVKNRFPRLELGKGDSEGVNGLLDTFLRIHSLNGC